MITAKERFYSPLPSDTHPETVAAFHTLHDNLFALRDEMQELHGKLDKANSQNSKAAFTLDLAGVKIAAPTDPTSLKNGMVPTYNAATGQFEFM